jgi:multidrug efflux system membrane fusion protein
MFPCSGRSTMPSVSYHAGGVFLVLTVTGGALGLWGCEGDPDQTAKPAQKDPPSVLVAEVTRKKVPVMAEFVGDTTAVKSVDIRARVEGYLEERRFTEGDDVKTGDVLYVLDQRPFQSALDEAEGQLAKDKATLAYAQRELKRYRTLVEKGDVSRETFSKVQTNAETAAADVEADEAAVKEAALNLSYATISAPFDGRIGQTLVNEGNLVSAQNTKLTTLVQLDPIYAVFNPSDEDLAKTAGFQAGGAALPAAAAPLPVDLILPGKTLYAHQGTLDFVNNEVDPKTGTLTMRATFPNPDNRLLPGEFVRVQVHVAEDADALLIPQDGIAEDQEGRFAWVVDGSNKVQQRPVTTGPSYGSLQLIQQGLEPGERVVVSGLQDLQPGMTVAPGVIEKAAGSNIPRETPSK